MPNYLSLIVKAGNNHGRPVVAGPGSEFPGADSSMVGRCLYIHKPTLHDTIAHKDILSINALFRLSDLFRNESVPRFFQFRTKFPSGPLPALSTMMLTLLSPFFKKKLFLLHVILNNDLAQGPAVFSHFDTGILLPSLIYLCWKRWLLQV